MSDRWGFTFPLDGVPLSAHREVLQEAERLGYTDAWTAETDGPDAFTPAALAALWSEQLRLGTAIASVFTRGPALLAQTAASVAEVANGRFVLGIGSSSPAIVERWNGLELRKPLSRVRDNVAFLRAAFAGERVVNEELGVKGFRLGVRLKEPPPIYIAALREGMLRLAGEQGDGVILNWLAPRDVPQCAAVAKDAAKAAGRDPNDLDVVARIFVLPTENEELIRAVASRAVAGYMTTPVYSAFQAWVGRGEALKPMQDAWAAGDRKQATELVPDSVIEDLFVTGTAQQCIDKIQEYIKAGVTTPVIALLPTVLDPKQMGEANIAALRALARQ